MTIKRDSSWKCPECGIPLATPHSLESHWREKHQRSATRLRQLINSSKMVVAPFCLNAFHAKIAQRVGFQAVYMTGFGTAAERGYPDLGMVTQTEVVQNAKYIANAVDVPVICDADTGYGNPINVWRTVREYEHAGVAGIHLEDQVFPKKCGFFEGKQVIPLEEHVQKIRAALDARRSSDFVIIARSDALAVTGWEDTIRRCKAYHEAGADLVFVDGIRTIEELRTYAEKLADVPRMYNGALLPTHEVEKLGFKVMITGGTIRIMFYTLQRAFQQLKTEGKVSIDQTGWKWEDMLEMLGVPQVSEMDRRYSIAEEDKLADIAGRR